MISIPNLTGIYLFKNQQKKKQRYRQKKKLSYGLCKD